MLRHTYCSTVQGGGASQKAAEHAALCLPPGENTRPYLFFCRRGVATCKSELD